jgi:hypothetical protein
MLRSATRSLTRRSAHATLVARDRSRLGAASDGDATLVAMDYHETEALIVALTDARRNVGPFDLAVLWIHGSADDTHRGLIDMLADQEPPCQVVEVRGSATANPAAESDERRDYARSRVDYTRVVLGFELDDGGSRWLTDSEISTGVLDAIDDATHEAIVGRVEPWDLRP